MAIARDATSHTSNNGTTASVTHTITGSNTILIAVLVHNTNEAGTVTFNGTSMTSIARASRNGRTAELFYLIAPTSGAHSLAASWATSGNGVIMGMSYTGAKQSGQPDAFNTGTQQNGSSNQALTVTATVVASNCWLVGGYTDDHTAGDPSLVGTGTSLNVFDFDTNASGYGIDSNGTVGTGSQSLQMLAPTEVGIQQVMAMASIAPATASGPANWKTYDTQTVATGLKTLNTNTLANIKSYDTIT